MSKQKNVCDLKSCFLCTSCLEHWIPAIANHKQNIILKKGQTIFREGDEVSGIYFVYEGNFKVHKRWDDEREIILRFAKKGDILGHLGLSERLVYPVTATAISSSVVCYIDTGFFDSTLNVNHGLVKKLMHFFANELQESERKMRNLVHMSVKGRVAQSVLSLKKQFGADATGLLNISISRQDLASFSGAVYESLFRTLNELENINALAFTGKNIVIKDESILQYIVANDKMHFAASKPKEQ